MKGDKKRLLFVITQGVVGGAQKYVFDLAKHFNHSGRYDVAVAVGGDHGRYLFEALKKENIKTISVKNLARNISVIGDLKTFFELMPGWKKKLAVLLEWKAAWFKDRIICVSQDDFNQALHHKIAPARKLYVVHNAVEVKFALREKAYDEIAKIIGRQLPEGIRLVNMGRLYANKDLVHLVEEVSIIKNKLIDKNISLVIFGDGPERQRIEPRIKELNLGDNVFLTGDIPNASQYLKTFDFLVLSSIKEGLPYSVLEAALAGLRIVSTEVGGVREIVGDDGLLAKPKAKGELAELILNDLNEDDNKVRARIERLKKSVVKNFNFETMVQKTEWVYKV
ncbi:MAG: glycosyltransferase [Candidatus Sungbacteria bacterium]|uniref:Glycosyltransferase n=2 Tax=Candidatus Sungiibacteriota bacterium TaxID=2750080 RepID=A0A932DSE8_9BACT|nr:glycosyltransferase [Candidatus Sungbacteria bacterium]